MKSTFEINTYSDLNQWSKCPFNYLIILRRTDNQTKINLIDNNIFDDDYKLDKIEEYKIPISDINYDDKNYHFNIKYYDKTILDYKKIYTTYSKNVGVVGYVCNDNCYQYIGIKYNSILNYINHINNFNLKLNYNELTTLEDLTRKMIEKLKNVPDLKVYVMMPNLNIVEYNTFLPCSTWNESYLFIKYEPSNLKKFYDFMYDNYKSNIQSSTFYYNHIEIQNYEHLTYLLPETFYQNDDKYWKGKKENDIIEIKYDLDPLIKKYKEEIDKLNEEIKKIRNDYSVKLKKETETQIEKIKEDYEKQLSDIKLEFDKIVSEKETEIIDLKFKVEESPTTSDETAKLIAQNNELEKQNEVIITQFTKMKNDYQNMAKDNKKYKCEIEKLKSKILKQDSIIKKLTSYDSDESEHDTNESEEAPEIKTSKIKAEIKKVSDTAKFGMQFGGVSIGVPPISLSDTKPSQTFKSF